MATLMIGIRRAADNCAVIAEIEDMKKAKVPAALVIPLGNTLEKYGLDALDYRMIYLSQGGVCPVCEKAPMTGRFYVDHAHVKGWKNMPPEKRKTFVRGLLCYFCNRFYLAKAISKAKAANIIKYLDDYAIRQAKSIQ